jgi:hypothetical protein
MDGITGEIYWPMLLQANEFTPFRTEVNRLFAQRATSGTIAGDDYLKLYETLQMMTTQLRQRILDFPQMDYMVARRFLESLAYEARLPAT